MRTILTTMCLAVAFLTSTAQVYEQSSLLSRMPERPSSVIGVTEEEKEEFREQIEEAESYLDSLARHYKHPMTTLEKSSQQDLFEFNRIWEDIYRMHDAFFSETQSKTLEQMGALSQEEFAKTDLLSEKLRKIRAASVKTMKDTRFEEEQIDKQMYDNHALYSQQRADLLSKAIARYRSLIENMAFKTKRADTLLLASITKETNYPCAAIMNAQYLLQTYKGYLTLFVPPYEPAFSP